MEPMVYGALAGLVPGAVVALIGAALTRFFMKKGTASAVSAAMGMRMLLDVLTLGGIFLLRGKLPFPYEWAMLGAAFSLTLVGIWQAARMSRSGGNRKEQ